MARDRRRESLDGAPLTGDFPRSALTTSVLADVTSVLDVGLVLGACLGAGLAGRFAPERRLRPRIVAAALFGGFLLGYGARTSFGCNIVLQRRRLNELARLALGAAALLGTPIAVKLRSVFSPAVPNSARTHR